MTNLRDVAITTVGHDFLRLTEDKIEHDHDN
jgi:hypothetical protein